MSDFNVGTQDGQQTQQEGNATPQVIVVQPQSAPQQQQMQQTQPQGLFSQDQVNAIVSGRVNSLNQRITELTNENKTLKTDFESYKTKFEELEQTSALSQAGIPASLVDYVKFEVSKLSSNGKSFADNLGEYVKANQSFIDSIKQNGQSNNGQQNGGQQSTQQTLQSPLLQKLAGEQVNTNGAGTGVIQNKGNATFSDEDIARILARNGIKQRK